jgi:hypothetical protein
VKARVAGVVVVVVTGAVALARFAPEGIRIDRDAHQGFGRLALLILCAALVAAAVHAWRTAVGWPVLPLLLAAVPGVIGHTKWVLVLSIAVLASVVVLELEPWLGRLDVPSRRVAAATAVSGVVFLGSWTLLHHLWYGNFEIIDTAIYQRYGDHIVGGRVPYRDFALEYPPGSIPAFVAPELTAQRGDFGTYGHSFEKWAAAWGLATVVLVGVALLALRLPFVDAAGGLALAAVSPLLLGNVMLSRFDLLPAALATGAVAALLHRRDRLAAVVLAAAICVKLYPAVLVPLGVAWVWRRRSRDAAVRWLGIVVAVCAAVFIPFAVLSPGGLVHSFGTQLGRPLQLESLGSAILIAMHHVAHVHLVVVSDHGSQNLENRTADAIGIVSSVVQVLAIIGICFAFARGPATRDRLVVACAGAVAAFIAFGKVFSPQYMIWLVPAVALVRAVWPRLLVVAGLVLTQLWFPRHYWLLALDFRARESWLLLARDVVIVALVAVLGRQLLQDERLREGSTVREPVEPVRGQVELGRS